MLPLGGADEDLWISEAAVAAALRHAAAAAGLGLRVDAVRVAPARSDEPRGPSRVEVDFAAPGDLPFPRTADRLRDALAAATEDRLGLAVAVMDLRVTALLDAPAPDEAPPHAPDPAPAPADGAGRAALSVPGAARLAPALIDPRRDDWQQIAVAPGYRALDVARAVRAAVPTAVLVTAVDQPPVHPGPPR